MVDSLKTRIRSLRRNAGRSEEEINRSAFSYVVGHLESMALEAACASQTASRCSGGPHEPCACVSALSRAPISRALGTPAVERL